MNWRRSDLKTQAKLTLHANYWKCVLVSLVLIFCGESSGGFLFPSTSTSGSDSSDLESMFDNMFNGVSTSALVGIISAVMGILIVVLIISIAISIFLLAPLEVGCRRFFIIARVENANLGEMGYGFEHSYMNIVKTQFFRALYTFFWSLLFVIPGIVKSYEYRMMPYLLAEDPDLSTEEAFRLSKIMMTGEKWNAFVLDLSFIGWELLNACTLGILGLFYVNPYYNNTCTELYNVLKQKVTAPEQNSNVYSGDVTGQPKPYTEPYAAPQQQEAAQNVTVQNAAVQNSPDPDNHTNTQTVGSSDAPFNTPYGQTPADRK